MAGSSVPPRQPRRSMSRRGCGLVRFAPVAEKRCAKCGTVEPVEEFPIRRASADDRSHWGRTCHAVANREYRRCHGDRQRSSTEGPDPAEGVPDVRAAVHPGPEGPELLPPMVPGAPISDPDLEPTGPASAVTRAAPLGRLAASRAPSAPSRCRRGTRHAPPCPRGTPSDAGRGASKLPPLPAARCVP